MVDVPSRFKTGILLILLISSCAKRSHRVVESQGLHLKNETAYADAVSIDSISFASGVNLWLLYGLIVFDGTEYPFQSIYTESPIQSDVVPIRVQAPGCFEQMEDDSIRTVLTQNESEIVLSWKLNDQFLMIRTVLTSEH